MPLSEDEKRILGEIEATLTATDPGLAELSETSVYRHAAHMLRWAILGLVGSLILLVLTFTQALWLGVLGFFGMLISALVIARCLERMGKAGINSLRRSIPDLKGATSFRDRFHRHNE